MKTPFRRRVWKWTILLLSGFVLLFLFRLTYSYTAKGADRNDDDAYISDYFSSFDEGSLKRNIASDSYRYKKSKGEYSGKDMATQSAPLPAQEVSVDQKYEKTATVQARSQEFDKDEQQAKKTIRNFNGIVQYEQNTGNKGNRQMHLIIGIVPEKFDTFYAAVKKIGSLKATDVVKVDKTSEFKNLNAKRASLEKIRESLLELKRQSGRIDEFINLQNRILEIEGQLQDLGVQLGDFSEENEFCTVRFSLAEGKGPIPVSTIHRVKVSFEWAIIFYFWFLVIAMLAALTGFLIVLIIDRLGIITSAVKKLNE
jgi:hypothetical protein